MSNDRWIWAQRAQELKFHQLESARKQAESWRNGLASVTLIYGAVLTVKGRSEFTSLNSPYPQVIAALLAFALALLTFATLSAIRAASGAPGDECLLTGEDLALWTRQEVSIVYNKIRLARYATVLGIAVIGVAVSVTWFAPSKEPARLNLIHYSDEMVCGEILSTSDGRVLIRQGADKYHVISLSSISSMLPVGSCP